MQLLRQNSDNFQKFNPVYRKKKKPNNQNKQNTQRTLPKKRKRNDSNDQKVVKKKEKIFQKLNQKPIQLLHPAQDV